MKTLIITLLFSLSLSLVAQTEMTIHKSKKDADGAPYYLPTYFFYEESHQPDMIEALGIAPSLEEVNGKLTCTGFLVTLIRNKYFSSYNIIEITLASGEIYEFKTNNSPENKLLKFMISPENITRTLYNFKNFKIKHITLKNGTSVVSSLNIRANQDYFVKLLTAIDEGKIISTK